jgi:hypothetical protein
VLPEEGKMGSGRHKQWNSGFPWQSCWLFPSLSPGSPLFPPGNKYIFYKIFFAPLNYSNTLVLLFLSLLFFCFFVFLFYIPFLFDQVTSSYKAQSHFGLRYLSF